MLHVKAKMGIGKWNAGIAENERSNGRKWMGRRVRGISVVGNVAGCAKNLGNQSGDVGSQGRNLSIGVEITKNRDRNDNFKERR